MNKTGQQFDMNPETFTLQNIFAMELHNFAEVISDIVNCAIKELAIEKVQEGMSNHVTRWQHSGGTNISGLQIL